MTEDEAEKYWRPARAAMPLKAGDHPNTTAQSKRLAALLGLEYLHAQYYFNIPLTPQLQNTLSALAGPHSATIIKMLELKKETT